jgi:hypothetical protein
VAVTVQRQEPFVVLDERDRIVGVGPAVASQFGPLLGSVMWDCFPGSEPLFKPYYDTARSSGEPVQFVQFYDGRVARITATLVDEGLAITWEELGHLDTTTFASFRESLVESLELLATESSSAARDQARHALRLIEGGQ